MTTKRNISELLQFYTAKVSGVFRIRAIIVRDKKMIRIVKQKHNNVNESTKEISTEEQSHIIGVLLTDYTNPYYLEIIRGIENYANRYGYLVITLMHEICDRNEIVTESIRLDAVINFTINIVSDKFIKTLISKHTVFVDFGSYRGLSFVQDYEAAMDKCFQRLKELGHSKVGFVSTIDPIRFKYDQRGRLYNSLIDKYGFIKSEDFVICNKDITVKSEEAGYKCGLELLKRDTGITAVFTTNDIAGFGLYRACGELGIKIPEDLSVIGFDGIFLMQYARPRFSTIAFDKFEYGRTIAEKIIECLQQGTNGIEQVLKNTSAFFENESIGKAKI